MTSQVHISCKGIFEVMPLKTLGRQFQSFAPIIFTSWCQGDEGVSILQFWHSWEEKSLVGSESRSTLVLAHASRLRSMQNFMLLEVATHIFADAQASQQIDVGLQLSTKVLSPALNFRDIGYLPFTRNHSIFQTCISYKPFSLPQHYELAICLYAAVGWCGDLTVNLI